MPTTYFEDSFAGSNGTPLSGRHPTSIANDTPNNSLTWETITSSFVLDGNHGAYQADSQAGGGIRHNLPVVPPKSGQLDYTIAYPNASNSQYISVGFGYSNVFYTFFIGFNGSKISLYKGDNNVASSIDGNLLDIGAGGVNNLSIGYYSPTSGSGTVTFNVYLNNGQTPILAYEDQQGGPISNVHMRSDLGPTTGHFRNLRLTDSQALVNDPGASNDPGIDIAPNNASIRYVGRWKTTSSEARCVCNGSSFEFYYTGNKCKIKVDVSSYTTGTYPHLVSWVDGVKTRSILDNTGVVTLSPTFNNVTSLHVNAHHVKVMLESSYTDFNNGVRFTGLNISTGGTMLQKPPARKRISFHGDSITAGDRLLYVGPGNSSLADVSPSIGWAKQVADALGLEYESVAYGGTLLSGGGGTSGPAVLPYVYNGVPWNPSDDPLVSVIYYGVNDVGSGISSANFALAYNSYLSAFRTKFPTTLIYAVCPFGAPNFAADMATMVGAKNDDRIVYRDLSSTSSTPAYDNTQDAQDNIHPNISGANKIAARLAPDIRTTMDTLGIGSGNSNGGGGGGNATISTPTSQNSITQKVVRALKNTPTYTFRVNVDLAPEASSIDPIPRGDLEKIVEEYKVQYRGVQGIYKQGDVFTVSGEAAIYLNQTYTSGPCKQLDLIASS